LETCFIHQTYREKHFGEKPASEVVCQCGHPRNRHYLYDQDNEESRHRCAACEAGSQAHKFTESTAPVEQRDTFGKDEPWDLCFYPLFDGRKRGACSAPNELHPFAPEGYANQHHEFVSARSVQPPATKAAESVCQCGHPEITHTRWESQGLCTETDGEFPKNKWGVCVCMKFQSTESATDEGGE
jgi:hypothetical protein